MGLDDCGANSACDNTMGSFECTCDDGFEGDNGRMCTGQFRSVFQQCSFDAPFVLGRVPQARTFETLSF